MAEGEPIRFSDVLTTASAVADYMGESDVRAGHLRDAIDILLGVKGLDDVGRPTSPLVRRPAAPGSTQAVRNLVQRWFSELSSDAHAVLDEEELSRMRADAETAARLE